jgi:hypothetical protein
MPRICKNAPRDQNGRPIRVKDLESALMFLNRFFHSSPRSSSYNRYLTKQGYSNALVATEQSSQALLKTTLVDIYVLSKRCMGGDPDAKQAMQLIIRMLDHEKKNLEVH